jgi:hypothetical protein
MRVCECPCGCLAAPIEPINALDGAFVIMTDQYDRSRVVCPMCAKDFHRSAWL